MRLVAAIVALVACVHAGIWATANRQSAAPNINGQLASVSYSPFTSSYHPDSGNKVTAEQIRADLKLIAPYTRAVRTYSSTGGAELVPAIAEEFGLKVTIGAWIDTDDKRNEREIRSAIALAKKYHNVNGVIVGNETVYRGDFLSQKDYEKRVADLGLTGAKPEVIREKVKEKPVGDLIKLIQFVKREVQVPVTTGEIYSVWLDKDRNFLDRGSDNHSELQDLTRSVDFIAAHVLPYWEGLPDTQATDQAIRIYNRLRQEYAGKRIVIAEFGWPSAGYNRQAANPGSREQAVVVRDFISHAEAMGIDYNIIEAIDQPWKVNEGSVGPYWGLFDASRQMKFNWSGAIVENDHWKSAGVAVLIGFLLSLPILGLAGVTLGQAAVLAISVHAIGAWCGAVFAYWNGHYFVPGAAFALGLGLMLLIPLVLIAIYRLEEIAAIAFGTKPARLLRSDAAGVEGYAPKVSIHIPAYREPPEMLKLTLDAVARLDYPNYECVVVINNTPDPAFWQPIEDYCRVLGDRFKFINVQNLAGFKAGALRLALAHTAEDAEVIGILDADYAVHPNWLKDLMPAFIDPQVGIVQAPQDHRDMERSLMHHAMNGEYAGFFDGGMVQRNEKNAIVVHGTMCLIRRDALEDAGGWSSDTICEDTDLGLAILECGWRAHYTNRRYGWGLLPDTYESFKKQRHRWAYGGAQIMRKHWRRMLPGASLLAGYQVREFAVGWLSWLGAESVGVAVAILNLMWVPFVAFVGIAIPDKILTLPIVASFVLSIVHFIAIYRLRVRIPLGQMLAAMFAAMSLQWTVAKAVCDGIIKDHLPFVRTAKGGSVRKGLEFQAFWEAVLGGLLVVGAVTLLATNHERIREINIFAAVLGLQSLPFLSAVAIAALEGSRFNDFAYWRGLEGRFTELLSGRPAIMADVPAPSAENQIESAQ
ncbi:MAG TPA: glycosyltransferase [Xanthobacteraceae bacterium]|jgi:cellulose synthase/poly-beta-1,6-N-acetylglucosamine synthase-like glycosyltransferase/exo-beta-1,3-glucanase (GH17 family)|nr:glycosyltransferase [Xanthobacteraceae bacterium]